MAPPTEQYTDLIKTRFLILSDTHGKNFESGRFPQDLIDVAVHCGDLTDGSRLEEFRAAITLLKQINAPLKLVVAGNHDFALDDAAFDRIKAEAIRAYQGTFEDSMEAEFGHNGAAKELLLDARRDGIVYLDEGLHTFTLDNGADLKIYSSPYTPSNGWTSGFQYDDAHKFIIPRGTDLVVTHGPPLGILDRHKDSSEDPPKAKRIGCPQLFQAVAKAQPRLHCFGHVHGDWGARLVTWRSQLSEAPSHFTDIDNNNGRSPTLDSLQRLQGLRLQQCREQNHVHISLCQQDEHPIEPGKTLFVNASVMGQSDSLDQLPWLVEIGLERQK
ncbi:Metallophosphoesterase domain protein [Moelleriella libera RCEF 2490]|uniref:Metallophosphoesterase domain protein n=1 Tax=Moelleriella libera RCEF 2490 TaxID=1081109 RepID=A0A168AA56_9HYPO|nr:Metallophosphoesterase domain protein [Moelleriella libera RCEF 2490]